jgi:polysaccharide deacetylase family protein (PEP-CTERM system associated)
MLNAMTVDVEDYFQVSAMEGAVSRSTWDTTPLRVEKNVERILELFDNRGIKATFFTLGWVAERCPQMISRIVAGGHELASHGWSHVRVTEHSPEAFREDVRRTKRLLEDAGATPVNGYRAASYSIGADNLWALDVLADEGYRYSSSIAPIQHDLYGLPDAPRFSFSAADGRLREIPVTTVRFMGRNINCAGGGWFRLFPYALSRWALRTVNKRDCESALFYFHPWEIDPHQPTVAGLSAKARFRHYLNLGRMESRLIRVLEDFNWERMDRVFFSEEERAVWASSPEHA